MTLKIKVKVTSFRNRPRILLINTWFKFEDKMQTPQKLSCSQGITQTTTQMTTKPKTICLTLVGGGET